jgi:hypothetical protein
MLNAEQILKELNIEEPVIGIYPYGSHVYGTNTEGSDQDFIIIGKGSTLSNGAFKNNAISNSDKSIQGVMYSRGGFIDAINNYDIAALECLFVEPILMKWPFKIQKWDQKQMVKKIIQKVSASWYVADNAAKNGNKKHAKKGIFHALRILNFALQLKYYEEITDFTVCNDLLLQIKMVPDLDFDTRDYIQERDSLMELLRK